MNDDASAEKNPARPGEYGPFSTPSPRSSDFGVRVALPTIPDHELLRRIGEGSYGEVWLARNKLGTLRAVKVVYRRTFEDARPFEREFRGIQKFEPISRSHDGLVDILQVGGTEEYFYYVMELADDASPERSDGVVESWSNGQTRPSLHSNTPTLQDSAKYTPRTLRHDLKQVGRLPLSQG